MEKAFDNDGEHALEGTKKDPCYVDPKIYDIPKILAMIDSTEAPPVSVDSSDSESEEKVSSSISDTSSYVTDTPEEKAE